MYGRCVVFVVKGLPMVDNCGGSLTAFQRNDVRVEIVSRDGGGGGMPFLCDLLILRNVALCCKLSYYHLLNPNPENMII